MLETEYLDICLPELIDVSSRGRPAFLASAQCEKHQGCEKNVKCQCDYECNMTMTTDSLDGRLIERQSVSQVIGEA